METASFLCGCCIPGVREFHDRRIWSVMIPRKKTKATTTTPSKEAAVDHSILDKKNSTSCHENQCGAPPLCWFEAYNSPGPPLAAPLDVFGAIRACAAWVFPIFGWALVIILVALIATWLKPNVPHKVMRQMCLKFRSVVWCFQCIRYAYPNNWSEHSPR